MSSQDFAMITRYVAQANVAIAALFAYGCVGREKPRARLLDWGGPNYPICFKDWFWTSFQKNRLACLAFLILFLAPLPGEYHFELSSGFFAGLLVGTIRIGGPWKRAKGEGSYPSMNRWQPPWRQRMGKFLGCLVIAIPLGVLVFSSALQNLHEQSLLMYLYEYWFLSGPLLSIFLMSYLKKFYDIAMFEEDWRDENSSWWLINVFFFVGTTLALYLGYYVITGQSLKHQLSSGQQFEYPPVLVLLGCLFTGIGFPLIGHLCLCKAVFFSYCYDGGRRHPTVYKKQTAVGRLMENAVRYSLCFAPLLPVSAIAVYAAYIYVTRVD